MVKVKCSLVPLGVAGNHQKTWTGGINWPKWIRTVRESQFVSVVLNFCPLLAAELLT